MLTTRAMDADIPGDLHRSIRSGPAAGLANEDGTNVGNITGTSDKLPVTEQMEMIRELMPDAKKIGILYTTSEANSCQHDCRSTRTMQKSTVLRS